MHINSRAPWVVIMTILWLSGNAYGQTGRNAPLNQLCAGCHGDGGTGTDRGPTLINSRSLRSQSEEQIRDIIRNGTQGGMPPFQLPEPELKSLAKWVHSRNASVHDLELDGNKTGGEEFFFGKGQCGSCHMVAGRGKTNGPDLSDIGRQLTLAEMEQALDDPSSRSGNHSSASCPGWAWCPQNGWAVVNVTLLDGSVIRGFVRSEGKHDLQLQSLDGRMHFLLDTEYKHVSREKVSLMPPLKATAGERQNLLAYLGSLGGITPGPISAPQDAVSAESLKKILNPDPGEWPTYNGRLDGNRYSSLKQINLQNARGLQLQWTYSLAYTGLETTPLVSDGAMYVSGPNQLCALDARTGREIWCYSRPRTPAGVIAGDAAKGANRGVAVLGDRVFFGTDDVHLLCINRLTGGLMWDVLMPDEPQHYGSTAAPLVVGDLVISGVAGGDSGIRGFLAAYKATTGELAWRFWTVPKPGEPGSETWKGNAIGLGGGSTWLTGSYDSETGLLYWPTGNPFPDTDGEDRGGSNLYTDCVVALDVKTGKLRWHFQFTPHDLHDWDATEPLVLVNTRFQGRERKLLLQGNRNGFFYVLDRTNGEFLAGKPFVKKLTWATGIKSNGEPQLADGNEPTRLGTITCPAVRGATNWYSTAFNPVERLFYVMAVEDCTIYNQSKLGGYTPYQDPAHPPEKYLRALDIETGKIVWEIPQVGPPESNYSGVLSTAGGLVFYGETGGGFAAVEAKSGRTVWHFETNQAWKASPTTYMVKGRQYVAIASGGNILSFALPEK
jgi:PQQ-dependent dehydrogenase (methanol/ethanol family)